MNKGHFTATEFAMILGLSLHKARNLLNFLEAAELATKTDAYWSIGKIPEFTVEDLEDLVKRTKEKLAKPQK